MRGNPGSLVQWTRQEGDVQKGIIRYKTQTEFPQLAKDKRVLIEVINDDLSPKMDGTRKVTVIKKVDDLIRIGYVD